MSTHAQLDQQLWSQYLGLIPEPIRRTWTAKEICESKSRFDTQEKAQRYAEKGHARSGWKIRPYKCEHCELWHITKRP